MKKILLAILVLLSLNIIAQQTVRPPSFNIGEQNLEVLTTYEAVSFDHDLIAAEDEEIEISTGRYNYGRIAEANINPYNSGTWTTLSNGDKIWRLKFKTEGAMGVSVFFENMVIPQGASVYLYDVDHYSILYPLTSEDNPKSGKYTTDYVMGDEAIIEYYQPSDVIGQASLEISGLGHFYRDVVDHWSPEMRGSDPCQVNVRCPEGNAWGAQIDGVVRLQISQGGFVFLCTGMMINTTAMDCRPYMLTALHCIEDLNASDLQSVQVKWNYERPTCTSGAISSSHNRVGLELLADSNDNGGNSGSDFALLEVIDGINVDWDTYFCGWDASGSTSSSGVSIHHPSGDIKKISTYTNNLVSASWGTFGTHWRVVWASTETNHGVTEGGSSGSPIFNDEGLVIGTLTGGGSFCNNPTSPDFYGKLSHHWTGNPNSAGQKLEVWLDPENTGDLTMFGSYAPNCNVEGVGVKEEIKFEDISIYPNPSHGLLNVSLENVKLDLSNVKIFNSMGALVLDENWNGRTREFDVKGFSKGIYYITFTAQNGEQLTKKFTKI